MPSIFQGIYHQPTGIAGLNYIALGLGLAIASQVNARFMDRVYMYYTKKNGGIGKPEYRLRASPFLGLIFKVLTFLGCSHHGPRDDPDANRDAHRRMDGGEARALDRTRHCE